MPETYAGPVRSEPLALELHNTLYASGGEALDGLASEASAAAWLNALAHRLPSGGHGRGPTRTELIRLRGAVRAALHAVLDDQAPIRASLEIINQASADARRSPIARWRRGAPPVADVDVHIGYTATQTHLPAGESKKTCKSQPFGSG